jgi:hypothetical protein
MAISRERTGDDNGDGAKKMTMLKAKSKRVSRRPRSMSRASPSGEEGRNKKQNGRGIWGHRVRGTWIRQSKEAATSRKGPRVLGYQGCWVSGIHVETCEGTPGRSLKAAVGALQPPGLQWPQGCPDGRKPLRLSTPTGGF